MPQQPTIRDLEGWKRQVMEHRRALFERLVTEFAGELRGRQTELDLWRILISGPRTSTIIPDHNPKQSGGR